MKLRHLILSIVAVAAVLPATADVHPRYTAVVSDATSTYVTKRPPAEERLFTSVIIEKRIKDLYPELSLLFLDFDSGTSEANIRNRLHFMLSR